MARRPRRARSEPYRTKLVDAVAEADDALLEEYLETGELDPRTRWSAACATGSPRRSWRRSCAAPRATMPVGVDRLAESSSTSFPRRSTGRPPPCVDKSGEEVRAGRRPIGPAHGAGVQDDLGSVRRQDQPGEGGLRHRCAPTRASTTRPRTSRSASASCSPFGARSTRRVSEIPAGDIGAIAKLAKTTTGDTLTAKGDDVRFPAIELPEPLYAVAVEPKTKGDEDKLSTALHRSVEEDPTVHVERSDETHQTVLYGMGEAHVDVLLERMKRKFGVEVGTAPARIPYRGDDPRTRQGPRPPREAVRGPRPVRGVPHRDRAPPPRRAASSTSTRSSAASIPNQWIASVEKGVVKAMAEGAVSGNPMVDIRCTLVRREVPPGGLLGHRLPDRRSPGAARGGAGRGRGPAGADRRGRDHGARRVRGRHHGRPQLTPRAASRAWAHGRRASRSSGPTSPRQRWPGTRSTSAR